MKKTVLLATLLAAIAMTACGKKEEAPVAAPAADAAAPAAAPAVDAAAAVGAAAGAADAATAAADAAKAAFAGRSLGDYYTEGTYRK